MMLLTKGVLQKNSFDFVEHRLYVIATNFLNSM